MESNDKSREIRYTYKIGEKVTLLSEKHFDSKEGEFIPIKGEVIDRVMNGTQELVNVRKEGGLGVGNETGLISVDLVRRAEELEVVGESLGKTEMNQGIASGYTFSEPKTPYVLRGAVQELEEVAVALAGGTLGVVKMREYRQKVIKAAIEVKGCADTWESEQKVDRREEGLTDRELDILSEKIAASGSAVQSQDRKHEYRLLFFGPDETYRRVEQAMEDEGILPESRISQRVNELVSEGWRLVFTSFEPTFVMRQWRMFLEREVPDEFVKELRGELRFLRKAFRKHLWEREGWGSDVSDKTIDKHINKLVLEERKREVCGDEQ